MKYYTKNRISTLIMMFMLLTSGSFYAKSYLVKTAAEITNAMKTATPGDTLFMQNGVWTNQKIVFDGNGNESANIYLIAETPGHVIVNGTSTLRIKGKYLTVDGLRFYGGYSSSGAVIEFRNGSSNADHCRLTNTSIVDYNPSDNTKDYKWVSIYGQYNRVDHCYLAGKTHSGTTLVVWLDKSTTPNYNQIDHNYFGYRLPLGVNGGETIRVGDSSTSIYTSATTVENNYFERCNGEIEIISNKSDGNIYRYNTFYECEGVVTMRHGDNCSIYGNFFFGNNKPLTGGVRLIAAGHKVYNNYFQDLAGEAGDWRGAIVMMNGIENSPLNGYFQVDSALVAFNTIVNCKNSFLFGLKKDDDPTQILPPQNSTIANNLVLSQGQVFTIETSPVNFKYEGNIISGSTLGIDKPDGIVLEDPGLNLASDGLYRPATNSPAISAAEGVYDFVTEDIDGQWRGLVKDIGADQLSSEAVVHKPLTPNDDVGPSWKSSDNLFLLTITTTGTGSVTLEPGGSLYEPGTIVKITATPSNGSSFLNWSGDTTSSQNPISIVMNGNKSYTANFKDPNYYKLSVWKSGSGSVVFNPAGGNYLEGTTVTVTAIPDAGWKFSSWGNALSGSQNPESVLMDKNISISATFEQITSAEETYIPTKFNLDQNYPNPFNPSTKISYQIPVTGYVSLKIYDALGIEVITLVDGVKQPGHYSITFDVKKSALSSGIYFYQLRAGSLSQESGQIFIQTRKMLLLK